MFSKNIEILFKMYDEVKGTGMYLALFFVALIYIFLKEENKNIKVILGFYSVVVLVVILNPLFNKLVDPFINSLVYWRVYWLLPIGITIAYVGTKLIQNQPKKIEKVFLFVTICLIIISSGKIMYTSENYEKSDNWYKIPNEAQQVTQIISEDINENHKKVMLPAALIPYPRQIDSSLELVYGRQSQAYYAHPLLDLIDNGEVEQLLLELKNQNCNYVVFHKAVILKQAPEDYAFTIIGQTQNYNVYKWVQE